MHAGMAFSQGNTGAGKHVPALIPSLSISSNLGELIKGLLYHFGV